MAKFNQVAGTTALMLGCFIFAVGFAWGGRLTGQLGEAVPDDVASSLKGGDCKTRYECAYIWNTKCYEVSELCPATFVVALAPPEKGVNYESACVTYCGSTPTTCESFPTLPSGPCIISGP